MRDDNIEVKLAGIFSIVGIGVLVAGLFVKGFSTENLLDTIFNASTLIVAIAVFLVARRLYKYSTSKFVEVFERNLEDWAQQNKYLISLMDEEVNKGKKAAIEGTNKRAYKMVVKHENIVFRGNIAESINDKGSAKGDFVILPTKKQIKTGEKGLTITFVVVKTFVKRSKYSHEEIRDAFEKCIIEEFLKEGKELLSGMITEDVKGIVKLDKGEPNRVEININIDNIDRTNQNANRLVDLVEYVKTMILAIC